MAYSLKEPSDIAKIFPQSVDEINSRLETTMANMQEQIDTIIAIPDNERTFENTAKALDDLSAMSDFAINNVATSILEIVSPQEDIRQAAHEAILATKQFVVDKLIGNVELYRAFKAYAQGNALTENLTEEQRYFVEETMKDFQRAGLDLPQDTLKEVLDLKKKLSKITLEYDRNIAADQSTIEVEKKDLDGCDQDFIENLKQTKEGRYILGVDYPTYFYILEHCKVEETRKQLSYTHANKAYEQNIALLEQIVATRDQLAKKLGYQSYAHYDLQDQMVKDPVHAEEFLKELIENANKKAQVEFKELTSDLPEGVTLTENGKLNPWNFLYCKGYCKKKRAVDERLISEYFPMEKTIDGLLNVYEQFMGLRFVQTPITGLWHEEVKLLEVFDNEKDEFIGYLLLDLHPRPFKYSHACEVSIVPSTYTKDGIATSALALVIANFPKSTKSKPSLLTRNNVRTFFHEFGHALHALLGRTTLASFAGTSVKRDFVEMPSQMLEEWLWDKEILKMVSSHYQTGDSLPDELIEKILKLKHLDSGSWLQGQCYYSILSLNIFKDGAKKDLAKLTKELYEQVRINTEYDEQLGHFIASWGHLTNYAAKYYGYMWAKVFAIDLFDTIKQDGLLSFDIGKRYIKSVIGKGGSKDPNLLLEDFLGRKPNQQAFLKDLGLHL